MTAPKNKSRSKKRIKVRTPSGKVVTHFRAKKPAKHACGRCGKQLPGTANKPSSRLAKLSKTEKVPERPYAGVLCTECTEELFRYKTRFEAKARHPEYSEIEFKRDLTLEKFLPSSWWENLNKKK